MFQYKTKDDKSLLSEFSFKLSFFRARTRVCMCAYLCACVCAYVCVCVRQGGEIIAARSM